MYRVELPIGRRVERVEVPEERVLYDLKGRAAAKSWASIAQAAEWALDHPIASPPLEAIVHRGEKVCIVISDITRLCGTDQFLPVLLARLEKSGVAREDVTLLTALGTHRPHTPAEDALVCGQEIARQYRIVQHACRDEAQLAYVGTTSFGTEVKLNRAVVEADRVIITGAVTLHPFAGFGGGRKAVMPGVAGYEAIMHNHRMTLAPEPGGGCNPLAEVSLLEDNPVNLDMMEGCRLLKPDFLLNTVYTPEGQLYEVVAGHWHEAWHRGCQDLLELSGVPIEEQADVVFTSAGGYPKDINLYQGTKCFMNAVFAVKPKGILIAALDCEDIKEPAIFSSWFSQGDLAALEQGVREDFTIPGFVAYKSRCIVNSVTTYLVTRRENYAFVAKTGQIPCASLKEAWELAQLQLAAKGLEDYTITIMSHGSATLPLLSK